MRAALHAAARRPALLFGDVQHVSALARRAGADAAQLREVEADCDDLPAGSIGLVNTGIEWDAEAARHHATGAGGRAQHAALEAAIDAVLAARACAVVTAPMSKAAVNLAGFEFTGHTEHLARRAGLADDAVTMMFLGPRLRVALVTTHLAVRDVPEQITVERVERTIVHLAEVLAIDASEARVPRFVVAGLNPHAGEGGLFGNEERDVVLPAMGRARARPPLSTGRVELLGVVGAETAFRRATSGDVDGVVAMMHDQATIASKLLDWTEAVNVTWGLPFVRTSVDHGVAYDAAERGEVDWRGMSSAIAMADRLLR